jgi:hypothetical protein
MTARERARVTKELQKFFADNGGDARIEHGEVLFNDECTVMNDERAFCVLIHHSDFDTPCRKMSTYTSAAFLGIILLITELAITISVMK